MILKNNGVRKLQNINIMAFSNHMYNKKYISEKKTNPAARFGNSLRDMFIDTYFVF